jgi:hypothetical protein
MASAWFSKHDLNVYSKKSLTNKNVEEDKKMISGIF